MRAHVRMAVLVGVLLGSGALTLADDLESVEKKLISAWDSHKSISAKLTVSNHMGGMEGTGQGTYEYVRAGDKLMLHVEMTTAMVQKMGDQEMKMDQSTLMVVDGEFAYTLITRKSPAMGLDQTMAAKSDIEPSMSGAPKYMFTQLRETNTLKLLPEQTIDGRKVFVIEASQTAETGMPGGTYRTVLCLCQETGMAVKTETFDADGKSVSTMAFSDIKVDQDIDPARFKWVAPEGVEVVDQTKKP